jgi:hypothetical protein
MTPWRVGDGVLSIACERICVHYNWSVTLMVGFEEMPASEGLMGHERRKYVVSP